MLSYDDLFRENDRHIGKTVRYTGKIIQVIEGDGGEFQLRANVTEDNGFWDDTVFLQYSGPRLLEDDIIEFVGWVHGLITYESIFGQDITIPAIIITGSRRLGVEGIATPTPSLMATPSPMPTPQPTPTPPAIGARENPVPFGDVAVYPDWDVSVVSFNPNANREIAEENLFNDPPDPGHVYVLVRVQGTYTGSDFGSMWAALDFYVVGNANVTYEYLWEVLPDALHNQSDVLSGGTVVGNVGFMVPENEVSSLLLIVSDGSLRYADTIGYFALE